jgi:M6 family metalloprotease-like protein
MDYYLMTTGSKRVVVILVDFPSADATTSGSYEMSDADIAGLDSWFKSGSKNFEAYFKEASYDQLNLDVIYSIVGGTRTNLVGVKSTSCFTMPFSMASYGQDTQNSLETLAKQAISAANVNRSDYDYAVVAHAGYGNESTSKSGDIWSVSVGFSSKQNGFDTAAIVPVLEAGILEPFGVMCHEFGHQLGLPDIYAPDTGEARVGVFALMDSGTWNDNGAAPPHICSWCKQYLGWISPIEIWDDAVNNSLNPYFNTKNSAAYKFLIPGKSGLEYFLLTYRKEGGYDCASHNQGKTFQWGAVILHIDDNIGTVSNNDINSSLQPYPRVDIVGEEAWGISEIFTAPDSNSYDGQVSGITIFGFDILQSYMAFSATIAKFSDKVCFNETPLNFPNPVRRPNTTISFKLSAPESDRSIRIYSPAGELIKTIDEEDIVARYIKDNEVVYQSDWNLRNEKGETVASGVYIYQVQAGSKRRFGGLTIIKE